MSTDILFDFGDTKEKAKVDKPKPKTYKTGGRGKKQCQNPDCGVFVGVRNKVCPVCNTEFKKRVAPKKAGHTPSMNEDSPRVESQVAVKTDKPYDAIIVAPAGSCPIKFDPETLTKESVIEWAESVREWGLDTKRVYLTSDAIIYYARYLLDPLSEQFKMIRIAITEWDI